MKRNKAKLKTYLTYKHFTLAIVVVLVAAIGVHYVFISHASSPYVSAETQNRTLTTGATLGSDTSTIGGKYVKFGGTTTTPPPSGSLAEGVYVGYGDPSGVASFASTTGTKITIAAEYLDGTSWSSIEAGISSAWKNSGYQMAIGVDMLPNSGASLAAGATGAYNSYFQTLAQNLVAQGAGNAILHIGWEWDQGNPWEVSTTTDATNFAAFWRQIVTTMRAVPGANFNYAWYFGDANDGPASTITDDAYPGSSYVTSIDLDFYDQTWDTSCGLSFNNTATTAQSQCIWTDNLVKALNGFASFASANNEPMGFGEWGVISRSDGHGLGDDPTYISNFASWISSHNVEYIDYFDVNSGGNSILTDYPNSLAQYKISMLNLTSTYQ